VPNLLVSISVELAYNLGSRRLVLNSIGNLFCVMYNFYPEKTIRFTKPEHPILVIEFLSGFFVNILLKVLQVVIVAFFNL
jgi:hypothetical protein